MQVILLEKHRSLGDVGDIATVKNGFARNFLIPNKKAVQATKENQEVFKQKKEALYKDLEKKKALADKINAKIENKWVYIVKQAGKDGRLYGSVSLADIVKVVSEQLKQEISKKHIQLLAPIKYIGRHNVTVNIFADIFVPINIVISRSQEEAEMDLKNAISGKPEAKSKSVSDELEKTTEKNPDVKVKKEQETLEGEIQAAKDDTDNKSQ